MEQKCFAECLRFIYLFFKLLHTIKTGQSFLVKYTHTQNTVLIQVDNKTLVTWKQINVEDMQFYVKCIINNIKKLFSAKYS